MILGAGVLVLIGLGLFIAGLNTGTTAYFWACVAACVVAAVLLAFARRQAVPPRPAVRASDATARTAARGTPAAPTRRSPAQDAAAEDRTSDAAGEGGQAAARSASARPAASRDDGTGGASAQRGEPPVEEVEVTDLLLVVDLTDEVLVVDEHPRYHLAGCRHLSGREVIPLPLDEARTDGFTPCGACKPDRHLAERVRARKAGDKDG